MYCNVVVKNHLASERRKFVPNLALLLGQVYLKWSEILCDIPLFHTNDLTSYVISNYDYEIKRTILQESRCI